jgi:hypothetical protein
MESQLHGGVNSESRIQLREILFEYYHNVL